MLQFAVARSHIKSAQVEVADLLIDSPSPEKGAQLTDILLQLKAAKEQLVNIEDTWVEE